MLFASLSTQWRHGFGGPTGLDYGVIEETMRLLKMEPEDSRELFYQLQVLEREALRQIAENQNRGRTK
jgi:hypothetical protein